MASNIPKPLMQSGSRDRYSPFARSVGHFIQSIRLASHMLIYRVSCFFLCHLWLYKISFGFLRRIRPVFIFKRLLVVTKAREVREVLERFDDFTLGDSIDPGNAMGHVSNDGRLAPPTHAGTTVASERCSSDPTSTRSERSLQNDVACRSMRRLDRSMWSSQLLETCRCRHRCEVFWHSSPGWMHAENGARHA